MTDARRQGRRARTRASTSYAKSPDATGSPLPCVVGGFLRGQPELALVVKAAAGLASVALIDDRLALVSTVLAFRPGALVIRPFDADQTSTAPLVLRVRREAPDVAILVVSSHPRGAGQPMLRAVQVGAQAIALPTVAELRAALGSLLQPPVGQ